MNFGPSLSGNDSVERRFDRQNESSERWSELTSTRFGSVTRTFSGRGSSRSTSVASAETPAAALRQILGATWNVVRFASQVPALALLALIRIYQRTVSPMLPVFFGSTCGCRFAPTCSHYAADAIRAHGVIAGITLAAIRILKCTPLHPGGFDPVPPRRGRPQCTGFQPPSIHAAETQNFRAGPARLL